MCDNVQKERNGIVHLTASRDIASPLAVLDA
jgi:hypothetical protein